MLYLIYFFATIFVLFIIILLISLKYIKISQKELEITNSFSEEYPEKDSSSSSPFFTTRGKTYSHEHEEKERKLKRKRKGNTHDI
jgi:hypothetical protein